jgi:hypothetical protein
MAIEVNPEEDFHVVLNGNVLALSLDALDAAYQGDRVDDSTLIWQQGFGKWMRLDAVLEALAGQDDSGDEAEELNVEPIAELNTDTYFVMVAEGDIKQMSLELIKDACRMEIIDDQTLVWQPGYTEWVPLCVLAGNITSENHFSVAPSLAPPATQTKTLASAGGSSVAPPPPSMRPSAAPTASAPPPTVAPVPVLPQASTPPAVVAPAGVAPGLAPTPFGAPSAHAPMVNAPSFGASPFGASPFGAGVPASGPSAIPPSALSQAPVALSIPATPPKASPWYNRGLVAMASLAAVFALHQNGVGAEITSEMIQGSAGNAQAKPNTATPYGLSVWLDDLTRQYHLDELSATAPAPEPGQPAADSEVAEPSSNTEDSADKQQSGSAASTTEKKPSSTANAFGAKLSNQPTARKNTAPTARPTFRKTPAKKSSSSRSDFDPMNGEL